MFNGSVGPWELLIVLAIVLLIFGPKRLPGLGRQLGRGMREFKESITGGDRDDEVDDEDAERPAVTRAAPSDTAGEGTRSEAAEALGGKSAGGRGRAA
jgi:sec-independent protein translocase protein TatA